MSSVKTVIGIVILLAIIVFGYWFLKTYTMASADDGFWIKINSNMPDPIRKWACQEVHRRIDTKQSPASCNDFWHAFASQPPKVFKSRTLSGPAGHRVVAPSGY